MGKRTDKHIWRDTDYNGRQVSLYEKERDHIVDGHPEMGDQFPAIYDTVTKPDFVFASSTSSIREVFVSNNCGFVKPHLYVRAIVEYNDGDGKIITAHATKKPEGGTGEQLFPKSEI